MNARASLPKHTLDFIQIRHLAIAPDNIRKTRATAAEDKELKASIRAQGVLQPLIVKAIGKGKFHVYAGGRRLEQTEALIEEDALPTNYAVPCVIAHADANMTEIAMIENMLQARMHPVDEYEAFSRLHLVDGVTVKEIALRFGRSEQNVKRTLAIGNVHPELRELCRQNKLEASALSAYAVTSDQERQLQAYHTLRRQFAGAVNQPDQVRALLTKDFYTSDDRLVQLIGLKAYSDRGGQVSKDLFEPVTYVHDAGLVETMAKEILEAAAAELTGWKWTLINLNFNRHAHEYTRVEPKGKPSEELVKRIEQAEAAADSIAKQIDDIRDSDPDALTEAKRKSMLEKLRKLEEQQAKADAELEQLEQEAKVYTANQMQNAGCVITVSREGKVEIHKGLARKEDLAAAAAAKTRRQATASSSGADPELEEEADAPALEQYSQTMRTDLSAYHLAAAKAELLYSPELMYQVMQFSICFETLQTNRLWMPGNPDHYSPFKSQSPIDVRISGHCTFRESSQKDIEGSRMHQELLEYRDQKLNLSWLKNTAAESWPLFQALDPKDVVKLVAWCAVVALQPNSFGVESLREASVLDQLLRQTKAVLAKHWRPTSANYFARIKQPRRVEIAREMYAPSEPPASALKMKAGEFCTWLEDRNAEFPQPKRWMPPGFRYLEPSEADEMYEALRKEVDR